MAKSTKYGKVTGRGRVTVRQARYLDNLKTAKTESEARELAGYSKKTSTGEIMEAIEGNPSLVEALDAAGVTPKYIADQYVQMLAKQEMKDSDRIATLKILSQIRGDFAPIETVSQSINFEQRINEAIDVVGKTKEKDWDNHVSDE